MLSRPVTAKTLETVSWRYRQIAEIPHSVDLIELSPGDRPQDARTDPLSGSCVTTVEEILGSTISERVYHALYYNGCRYNHQCFFYHCCSSLAIRL